MFIFSKWTSPPPLPNPPHPLWWNLVKAEGTPQRMQGSWLLLVAGKQSRELRPGFPSLATHHHRGVAQRLRQPLIEGMPTSLENTGHFLHWSNIAPQSPTSCSTMGKRKLNLHCSSTVYWKTKKSSTYQPQVTYLSYKDKHRLRLRGGRW